jgi:glycosyltransferase involved in cell wall biosynthesis
VNEARNVGVRAARGQFVLLCDADDVVREGWVDAQWRAFRSGVHAVGGGLDRILNSGEILSPERKLYRPLSGEPRSPHRVGGFDEAFAGGADESEFFWRLAGAGYVVTLVPDAFVDKRMHTQLGDAYNQFFHYGRGEARLMRKFRPRMLGVLMALAVLKAAVWE